MILVTLLYLQVFGAAAQVIYKSNELFIHQLTRSVYIHETFLETEDYGKVSCNGMVVINDNEALIVDTPSEGNAAIELVNWIEQTMASKIKAVVVNHHHVDCLGSLEVFHQKSIPSYSSYITAKLAEEDDYEVPNNTFTSHQKLRVGKLTVLNQFFGPAHAQGNVATYVQGEEVIFGGCMVKSLRAGMGNLADADVVVWPKTIQKIKQAYPTARYVIPGHGKVGGLNLLDVTIEMFE